LPQQHAAHPSDQLHDGLVGLDLGQHVARSDLLAFLFLPLDEATLFHCGRECLHHDLSRH
jgi:hypothetical protein